MGDFVAAVDLGQTPSAAGDDPLGSAASDRRCRQMEQSAGEPSARIEGERLLHNECLLLKKGFSMVAVSAPKGWRTPSAAKRENLLNVPFAHPIGKSFMMTPPSDGMQKVARDE